MFRSDCFAVFLGKIELHAFERFCSDNVLVQSVLRAGLSQVRRNCCTSYIDLRSVESLWREAQLDWRFHEDIHKTLGSCLSELDDDVDHETCSSCLPRRNVATRQLRRCDLIILINGHDTSDRPLETFTVNWVSASEAVVWERRARSSPRDMSQYASRCPQLIGQSIPAGSQWTRESVFMHYVSNVPPPCLMRVMFFITPIEGGHILERDFA